MRFWYMLEVGLVATEDLGVVYLNAGDVVSGFERMVSDFEGRLPEICGVAEAVVVEVETVALSLSFALALPFTFFIGSGLALRSRSSMLRCASC